MANDLPSRIQALTLSQKILVADVIGALEAAVSSNINSTSDICTPKFSEDFQNRLVLHHAINDEVLKKKTFEYAFRAACRFDGRSAELDENSVNPGADIVVDNVAFSLKTEASKNMSKKSLHISKLMEASWIRLCKDEEDIAQGVKSKVVPHLNQYERILMLRAFTIGGQTFEYFLIEIPLKTLLEIKKLSASDFSKRTKKGSSRAAVQINGEKVFSLGLDGSVEKITISSFGLKQCTIHGQWTVPDLRN